MASAIRDAELATPLHDTGYISDFGHLPKSPIKQVSLVVFDDFITGSGGTTAFSNELLNGLLGAFDQTAIQIVTDRATVTLGALTLSAQLEHAGDARAWVAKATSPEVPTTALSATTTTTLAVGYDDGSLPSMGFVRIRFSLSSASTYSVHVKCTVTLNNSRERAFTRKVLTYLTGHCVSYMDAGTTVWYNGSPGLGRFWGDARLDRATKLMQANIDEPGTTYDLGRNEQAKRYGGSEQGDFFLEPYFHMRWSDASKVRGLATLKPPYRICFRADGTLAVLDRTRVVEQTVRGHPSKR